MAYEIWDDGNRLGRYKDQTRALKAVRSLLEDEPRFEETLVLLEDSTGRPRRVASGPALSRLAKPRVAA